MVKRVPPTAADEIAQGFDPEGEVGEEPSGRYRSPVHPTREALTPRAEQVHQEQPDIPYRPPMTLEAPPPRKGFTQRWIRMRWGEAVDVKNWSRKMREGWTPRDPATVSSEFFDLPKVRMEHGSLTEVISVEGMVLCEMPIARKRARDAYFRELTDRQMQAVDEDLLKVQRQGGLQIQRAATTRVSVGQRSQGPLASAAKNSAEE